VPQAAGTGTVPGMTALPYKGISRRRVNNISMAGKKARHATPQRPPLNAALVNLVLSRAISRVLPGEYELSPPVYSLLSANLITIVLAIIGNWDAATTIFIFWAQSVIIGIFTIASIIGADTLAIKADIEARDRERGEDITLDPRRIRRQQFMFAGMFFVHYGIFHLAYYDFIINSAILGPVDIMSPGIWASCAIFFANHLYSFLFYRTRERRGEEYVNLAFIAPYFRIVPMHLIIFIGAIIIVVLSIFGITSTLPVLVVFLLLKTAADLAMHLWKHTA
jgi:hypothetical protein